MKNEIFYKQLVSRYLSKKTSEEELIVFFQLLKEGWLDKLLDNSFLDAAGLEEVSEQAGSPVETLLPQAQRFRISRLWTRIAVAASVAGIISLGAFLFLKDSGKTGEQTAVKSLPPASSDDLPPGRNRAVLTLADGSSIMLDSAGKGQLAEQGALKIIKLDSDQLAYQGSSSIAIAAVPSYNTISTPRGSQFQVILPDGTKAWLNAASSLHFPTVFTGKERIVELDGESYFEVAHNASMPFRVKMKGGIDIKVLGTHFNVHSYSNEPVRTTLLEGSIRLQSEQGSAVLKAGQEASVKKSGELDIVNDADIDQAIAWKNGLFEFNKADIGMVMRQIERWYDVEIVYQGEIPKKEFVGKFSRSSNISEVLQILELSKIHLIREGRKITILP